MRKIVNILDLLKSVNEGTFIEVLSSFRCSKNKDVEKFLHDKAKDFALQKKSVTYIVFDNESACILGYFTLAHKSIEIPSKYVKDSNTFRKKLSRYAQLNNEETSWSSSAFLIAQFAKNDNIPENIDFSGADLMDDCFKVLLDVQHKIGGGIVYLDAVDELHLRNFYEKQVDFFEFGSMYSDKLKKTLIQYMKFLR